MRLLNLAICMIVLSSAAMAEDAGPSELQKKVIGHWIADKDNKLHTYFAAKHRIVERDIANSDAQLDMQDYQVWEEWPELRTILLTVDEGTRIAMLVITVGEDGKSAVWRIKSGDAWSKSHRILRVDNKTHPGKLPEKLKILDMENGLGGGE